MNNNVQHVTVEATSKKHKLQLLCAYCIFFGSLILFVLPAFVLGETPDSLKAVLGVSALLGFAGWLASCVWLTAIESQVWWHHG